MASADPTTASPSGSPSARPQIASPIYERFSRLSTFSSSTDSFGTISPSTARGATPSLALQTSNFVLPSAQRPDSAPSSPWVTSPGSFYQATFADSPSARSEANGSDEWTRSSSPVGPPVEKEPLSPTHRPSTTHRRISILGGILKKKSSISSPTGSSVRASSPLGARSPTSPSSGPRLAPLAFDSIGNGQQQQLDSVGEMRLTRGSNTPARVESERGPPATLAPARSTARTNAVELAAHSRAAESSPSQPLAARTTREASSSGHSSDAHKSSSDDLHLESATSGSAPATPRDESQEWTPQPKSFHSHSTGPSFPPGARAPTSANLTPSNSQSFTASPSLQSSLSASTGYSPLAAFFGGATSPPPRPVQAYASPPSTVQSSPANASPVRQVASTQGATVKRTLAYSKSGVPLPPGYNDGSDDEDPYAEFARRKAHQNALPTPVTTPPRTATRAPRAVETTPVPTSPVRSNPASPIVTSNTASARLRAKNSFFVSDETPVTPTAPVPSLPSNVKSSRVAAAIEAADAARAAASSQKGPPTPKKDGNEFSPKLTQSPEFAQARPAPASTAQPQVAITPELKTTKTLPPAPTLPRKLRQEVPAQVAPQHNLRAAALASAVQREQVLQPVPQPKQAPPPAPAPAQVRFAAPSAAAVQPQVAQVGQSEAGAEEAIEPEEPAPPAPRVEYALSTYPTTILVNILGQIEYDDFRALRTTSKTLFRLFDGYARELVLQRFLGPLGYRTLNPTAPAHGAVIARSGGSVYQTNGRGQVVSRRTGAASDNGHSSPSERNLATTIAPAARADVGAAGGIHLTLRDLDAFLAGIELELLEYGKMARQDAAGQLHPSMARLARASTRAFNRVVLRLRAQAELPREGARPAYYFRHLPKSNEVVYKFGRAPMLRVWVPTARGASWMGDEEVVECEREIWRAGAWNLVRRGDLVRNVALGDFANEGKLISDGKYLRDLEYKFDVVGHLPSWVDMLGFAPGYYHNLISASESNPVFYLSLRNFSGAIRDSLLLCTDKVQVASPQGSYTVKRFVYRGATKIKTGTIIGTGGGAGGFGPGGLIVTDEGWAGQVVVETEGTTEHATMLLKRCESKSPTPWKILRDKSRPNCIWLSPVTDDMAI